MSKLELSEAAKEARRAYNKAYREKNKERLREYHRNWRKQNGDKIKAAAERSWEKKAQKMGL